MPIRSAFLLLSLAGCAILRADDAVIQWSDPVVSVNPIQTTGLVYAFTNPDDSGIASVGGLSCTGVYTYQATREFDVTSAGMFEFSSTFAAQFFPEPGSADPNTDISSSFTASVGVDGQNLFGGGGNEVSGGYGGPANPDPFSYQVSDAQPIFLGQGQHVMTQFFEGRITSPIDVDLNDVFSSGLAPIPEPRWISLVLAAGAFLNSRRKRTSDPQRSPKSE